MRALLYPLTATLRYHLRHPLKEGKLRWIFLFIVTLIFLGGIFYSSYRFLGYLQSVGVVGELIIIKLLSMILLLFFILLVFSNLLVATSTYYLSGDIRLLITLPISAEKIHYTKFMETMAISSWMIMLFALPVFLAYGLTFRAPPLYYLLLLLIIPAFLAIPAAGGIVLSMLLATSFPARKLKDMIFMLFVLLFVIVYLVVRLLRPERLLQPDSFGSVVAYLAAIKTPHSSLLPSNWLTSVMASSLGLKWGGGVINTLLLLSTAASAVVITGWLANLIYPVAISRAQEGSQVRISRGPLFESTLQFLLKPFSPPTRTLMTKDIKIFFRDKSQWSQLLLLGALMIVYLYNFKALPLGDFPIGKTYLVEWGLAFLNIGLVGFVLIAVAARLIYPLVSLEGKSYWIVASSPLSPKKFIFSKFWVGFPPLAILSCLLVGISAIFLKVSPLMMLLSILSVLFMSLALASLGIGMGALYPRFEVENVARIATDFGGVFFMILGGIFVGVLIVLEAWPIYKIFQIQQGGSLPGGGGWIAITFLFALALIWCISFTIYPLKLGIRSLSKFESQ